MVLALRPPRPGDGPALARCWLDAGASYAALNPTLFQVPAADGLAQSLSGSPAKVRRSDSHRCHRYSAGAKAHHLRQKYERTPPTRLETV